MEVKLTAVVLKYVKLNYMSKTRLRSKTWSSVTDPLVSEIGDNSDFLDRSFLHGC